MPDTSSADTVAPDAADARRRWSRRAARGAVRLRLLDPAGATVARGRATMRDVTPAGAWLDAVDLDGAGLPAGPFRIAIEVTTGELVGTTAVARPVRATFGESLGLAIEFEHLRVTV